MDCSDAKHLILLDAGGDLRTDEETQLAEHMSRCGECREYHAGMSHAMDALLILRDKPSTESSLSGSAPSVWPAVSREIQRRRTTPAAARRFNLQVAALSVCSLSLAVVTMVQSLSTLRETGNQSSYLPAQSVSHQMNVPRYLPPQSSDVRRSPEQVLPLFPNSGTTLPQSF